VSQSTSEFGRDVEVLDASRRRSGGAFGFFAKERFVVTASGPATQQVDEESDFADVLMAMANEVSDTYEPTPEPETEPEDPRLAIAARARQSIAAAAPPAESASPTEQRPVGVIDLREGKRVQPTGERPSVLRRRIEAAVEQAPSPVQAPTQVVSGPLPEISDSAPAWNMDRLRELGLPESILATIFDFDPASDVEWLHAVSIAIGRLLPEQDADNLNLHVGNGRGSAVDLVRGIEAGLMPAYMVVDGVKVRATADELALSIRWCLA